MIRWRSLVLGGLVFAAAHFVQWAEWRAWFQPAGDFPPWFLNSGPAVALVVGCLFVAGLAASILATWTRQESLIQGCGVATGAVVAMTIVLFATGPGTLFPIVLAIGAVIVTLSSVAGALAGWALKSVLSRFRA